MWQNLRDIERVYFRSIGDAHNFLFHTRDRERPITGSLFFSVDTNVVTVADEVARCRRQFASQRIVDSSFGRDCVHLLACGLECLKSFSLSGVVFRCDGEGWFHAKDDLGWHNPARSRGVVDSLDGKTQSMFDWYCWVSVSDAVVNTSKVAVETFA